MIVLKVTTRGSGEKSIRDTKKNTIKHITLKIVVYVVESRLEWYDTLKTDLHLYSNTSCLLIRYLSIESAVTRFERCL